MLSRQKKIEDLLFLYEHLKKTAKTKNKSTNEDTRLDDCPICLIPDNERSPYWIDQRVCLKCGHAYHSECIHDWIKTKTASEWNK